MRQMFFLGSQLGIDRAERVGNNFTNPLVAHDTRIVGRYAVRAHNVRRTELVGRASGAVERVVLTEHAAG